MHGNEACAANSMSCAERICAAGSPADRSVAPRAGTARARSAPEMPCLPGRAGPQAPAGVVLHRAANRPAPQRWGSCPVTVLQPGTTCAPQRAAPLRAVPVGGYRVHTADGTTPAATRTWPSVARARAQPRSGAAGACWGRCSVGQFWTPPERNRGQPPAGRRRLLACLRPRAL
jgi:hypothetical protein